MVFNTPLQQPVTDAPAGEQPISEPSLNLDMLKTERAEMTLEFDRERERIHRQMLSSVSHDLKTPLVSIIGSLEVYLRMQNTLSEDKKATLIQVALNESYRLDNFINNILDMAKLENGMVKPRREATELGALVRNSVARLGTQLRGGNMDMKSTGNVELTTDSMLLSRAIGLVLNNAIRFGGSPLQIQVEYGAENDTTGFIKISDNGPGIPDDQKESVFSKYTRLVKEDQQNAGTGLGLAICRSMMALLKGDIVASDNPGGGSCFTLRFPLQ